MSCTEIDLLVASQLPEARYRHSVSTAKEAQKLLARFVGLPDLNQAAWIAGLWHDSVRHWSETALLSYVEIHDLQVEEIERAVPMLLHAPVASAMLVERIPDVSETILNAIRWHTLGSSHMGILGAAIYIADYLEPLRTHLVTTERQRLLDLPSLEELCLQVSLNHQEHLMHRGKSPAPSTCKLVDFLQHGGRFT